MLLLILWLMPTLLFSQILCLLQYVQCYLDNVLYLVHFILQPNALNLIRHWHIHSNKFLVKEQGQPCPFSMWEMHC